MGYSTRWFLPSELALFILVVSCSQCKASELDNKDVKQDLVVLALLPLSGDASHIGQKAKVDITDTLLQINSNNSILQGYRLIVEWLDTECEMAAATKALFDQLSQNDNIVFIYGGFCTSVTKPIAESMAHFNLWQISFANTDPTLSDVSTYKNFLRVIPNDIDFNIASLRLLQFYNWTRVALLFQDASSDVDTYAYTNSDMISLLKEHTINFTSESIDENSMVVLKGVVERDYRIIIASFDYTMAQRTICLAYHMGMYGYKYVWLLSHASTYPYQWWTGVGNCSTLQMLQALQGHFTIDILSSQSKQGIYSAMGSDKHSSHYSGYTRDGVWLMATALDTFTQQNHPPDWSKWHELTDPSFVTERQFLGNTGLVKFSGRRRLGSLILNQWADDGYINIGQVDMNRGDNIILHNDMITWHGRSTPPLDSLIRVVRVVQPNMIIRVSLHILASLGLILAFAFLAVNIKYAEHRYIKMSSPKMNNIILIGCILVYVSIYIARLNPAAVSLDVLRAVYVVRSWVLSLGFSLAFGPLFAKTWRVYMIFHSPHHQKKLITDGVLFGVVATLLVIDLIILITWAVVDPQRLHIIQLNPREEENQLIIEVIYKCVSERVEIWAIIINVYKGLLLVVGCFFAWRTRRVSIPALNDSKFIGLSVYNVVIMSTSAVAISYVLKDKQDQSDLITGLLTIICTTITLCLVFVPKIMHLYKDPRSSERRPRLTATRKTSSSRSMVTSQPSAEQFNTTELKVAQLEEEVASNQLLLEKVKEELHKLRRVHKAKLKQNQSYSISSVSFALEAATVIENVAAIETQYEESDVFLT